MEQDNQKEILEEKKIKEGSKSDSRVGKIIYMVIIILLILLILIFMLNLIGVIDIFALMHPASTAANFCK